MGTDKVNWTKNKLEKLGRQYEETYPKDIALEKEFLGWFTEHRHLTKPMFVKLGRWKTVRQTKNYKANTPVAVKRITKEALASNNEEERIEKLMELKGVGWPVASVILHFAFPNKYPILDVRAAWSLGVDGQTYNMDFWLTYVEQFRKLQKKTGLPARTIDRALWMHSKLNQ